MFQSTAMTPHQFGNAKEKAIALIRQRRRTPAIQTDFKSTASLCF
jgi:hypothetical protein